MKIYQSNRPLLSALVILFIYIVLEMQKALIVWDTDLNKTSDVFLLTTILGVQFSPVTHTSVIIICFLVGS